MAAPIMTISVSPPGAAAKYAVTGPKPATRR